MSVDRIVVHLRQGGLAIFPTETLWSLSAVAFDREAPAKLASARGRPAGVPLAVAFPSWGMARQYVRPTPLADRLAEAFLPGPLSLVLDRVDDHLDHVAPDLPTLSIRVPDHPIASEILDRVGPCIMTSANRGPHRDPVTAQQVRERLPGIPIIGTHARGEPSTLVDARQKQPVILRRGVVPVEHVAA